MEAKTIIGITAGVIIIGGAIGGGVWLLNKNKSSKIISGAGSSSGKNTPTPAGTGVGASTGVAAETESIESKCGKIFSMTTEQLEKELGKKVSNKIFGDGIYKQKAYIMVMAKRGIECPSQESSFNGLRFA